MKIPISSIIIGERQRLDLGDINAQATSMETHGQIMPILVEPVIIENPGEAEKHTCYRLIDGRRRLAAATQLNWLEIECVTRENLTEIQRQELEYEADIQRLDRSWQDKCLSMFKLFTLKKHEYAKAGTEFSMKDMVTLTNYGKSSIAYMCEVAKALQATPRDEQIWSCDSPNKAKQVLLERQENLIEKRRQELAKAAAPKPTIVERVANFFTGNKPECPVQCLERTDANEDTADKEADDKFDEVYGNERVSLFEIEESRQQSNSSFNELTYKDLKQRAARFNLAYSTVPRCEVASWGDKPFLQGFWFLGGGGNTSSFYGSYQVGYLERMEVMFGDLYGKETTIHLFSGSLAVSDEYSRVGIDPTGKYQSDYEVDAHELSSHLPFKPKLIYADPPYSIEDSEHYKNSMVNRARVLTECAAVLQPGGYVIWMDQALPVFSNDELLWCGAIGYIRSTGNRFRVVNIFRKPL